MDLDFISISLFDLCLSADEFLDIHPFFSIVPTSFVSIVLMKYLIVLFLLHLLNINIPILPNHIILPLFDSALRGPFWPDRVKNPFSLERDRRRLFQIEN